MREQLARWIRSKVRDSATVDDLTQETILHAARTARRHAVSDPRQIAKIAQRIATRLVARIKRKGIRSPETNRTLDASAAEPHEEFEANREQLAALRTRLEPRLGPRQRALLAAFLDEGITSILALAIRLGTSRANVRRMIKGIAKKIVRLD